MDPIVQVGDYAGVVGNDADELADPRRFGAGRRAHVPVLLAQAMNLPVRMLHDPPKAP